jgi:hypothetical protein
MHDFFLNKDFETKDLAMQVKIKVDQHTRNIRTPFLAYVRKLPH